MKYGVFLLVLLAVFAIACVSAASGESQELTPSSYVPWLDYSVGVSHVQDRPLHVTKMPPLDKERLMYLRIVSKDTPIQIRDIFANIEAFYLLDPDGGKHMPGSFLPQDIVYIERNGTLSSAQEQNAFDLLFVVPEKFEAAQLTLVVETELHGEQSEIPLGGVPMA